MGVIFELGRILLVGGARAAARGLLRAADVAEGDAGTEDRFFIEDEPGPLVSDRAAELLAAGPFETATNDPPPLVGSLAARGRRVGEPWAR